MFLSTGIQTAVRMLEHTLKNLNVYRDSKPKLDSIQTAYREREKRVGYIACSAQYYCQRIIILARTVKNKENVITYMS